MNVKQMLALKAYVEDNREMLEAPSRGTLTTIAAKAAAEMGFKVSVGAMSSMLNELGIATKRISRKDAERLCLLADNERLQAENNNLRGIIAKMLASKLLPDDLRDIIFSRLPEEMREAILSR